MLTFSGEPVVLRPRLQRLLERFNGLPFPVLVLFFRAREGRLRRWELEVRTPAKPWAGRRVALSVWRREPDALSEWQQRRGREALPFQHPRPQRGAVPNAPY